MTLLFRLSAAQQEDLDRLLTEQQDPNSPHYHRWLSPEQYADRFGISSTDVDQIAVWLGSQNLAVTNVSRARTWIAFQGAAADVESALGTKLHLYQTAEGELHFANASDPSIPAALQTVVRSVNGLNDFRLKPKRHAARRLDPNYTNSRGTHYLSPGDFSIIYNTRSLYNAGVTGLGQKIAVVGQTQIKLADIQQFRSYFGLAPNDPKTVLVPNTRDPGLADDDMVEADLDVEWAGAIAPNASIVYVYSYDVMDAVQYAIDQNIAPVLSMSYGSCELENSASDAADLQALAKRANAQGITWFAASGDDGGPDCGNSSRYTGLSVDLPAGIPEVTGVGGTTLNEGTGNYWGTVNDSTRSSAIAYIPETSWNDTATVGSAASSGGGASRFYGRPSWQNDIGVPDSSARSVPDVALPASNNHDGYLVYNDGSLVIIGGTSAGAPSFAGITALLNQSLGSGGQGNINPRLYQLAQTNSNVFHDIATGNNVVSPCSGKRGCSLTAVGYNAGPGYDQVTGLGSVDAFNLIAAWRIDSAVSRSAASLQVSANSTSMTSGDALQLTATVSGANGGSPTGSVQFAIASTVLGSAPLSNAAATLSIPAGQLPVGLNTITAVYSGDGGYNTAFASIAITVRALQSGPPSITGAANGASFRQSFSPGMIVSLFGSNLAPSLQAASAVPLPTQLAGVSVTVNGLNAPLYYVSPNQLNLQVPYEVNTSAPLQVVVNNNGQSIATQFAAAAAAPGIFVDGAGAPIPNAAAKPGQVVTLFITGAGALSPTLASGTAPPNETTIANLPKPLEVVTVSVGGVPAAVQFAGNPAGLVGVVQVNYQVPAGAGSGVQPVLVSIGRASSAAAHLTVTP